MGVVNVTPDSFSDGGLFEAPEAALRQALKLIEEGADLLDVGGESSRPGAEPVSAATELARILPVVKGIRERSEIPISVDTYKASVASAVIEAGAEIINDISAFRFDADLPPSSLRKRSRRHSDAHERDTQNHAADARQSGHPG